MLSSGCTGPANNCPAQPWSHRASHHKPTQLIPASPSPPSASTAGTQPPPCTAEHHRQPHPARHHQHRSPHRPTPPPSRHRPPLYSPLPLSHRSQGATAVPPWPQAPYPASPTLLRQAKEPSEARWPLSPEACTHPRHTSPPWWAATGPWPAVPQGTGALRGAAAGSSCRAPQVTCISPACANLRFLNAQLGAAGTHPTALHPNTHQGRGGGDGVPGIPPCHPPRGPGLGRSLALPMGHNGTAGPG